MAATLTTPLLPITVAISPDPPPTSRLQRSAIATFSILRLLRGISLVAYPRFGLYALDIPASGPAFMLTSMLGVRDILIAGMLYTADVGSRLEVSRALTMNLLSDAMDAFVLIFYTAWSSNWGNPLGAIIVTALMAVLEHLTLWSMSDVEGTASRPRYMEDDGKRMRTNAWLSQLRPCEQMGPVSPLSLACRDDDSLP
ncbi:hypothetical protein G7046_g3187 [Stylonectria norvegica]|nr:hypothetical protein G7046_g3187 [Stylonectria norvegica]